MKELDEMTIDELEELGIEVQYAIEKIKKERRLYPRERIQDLLSPLFTGETEKLLVANFCWGSEKGRVYKHFNADNDEIIQTKLSLKEQYELFDAIVDLFNEYYDNENSILFEKVDPDEYCDIYYTKFNIFEAVCNPKKKNPESVFFWYDATDSLVPSLNIDCVK